VPPRLGGETPVLLRSTACCRIVVESEVDGSDFLGCVIAHQEAYACGGRFRWNIGVKADGGGVGNIGSGAFSNLQCRDFDAAINYTPFLVERLDDYGDLCD